MLPFVVFAGLLFAVAGAAGNDAPEFGEGPLEMFSSGILDYDFESGTVSASGPVEAAYGPYRLEAGSVVWKRETGEVSADGGVVLRNPGTPDRAERSARGDDFFEAWWPTSYAGSPFVLRSRRATLSRAEGRIAAGPEASARFPYGRLNAGRIVARTGEGAERFAADTVESGSGIFLVGADSVEGDGEAVELFGATVYLGEPSDWGPRIHADRIRRERGDDHISLYGMTLAVGPVPLLYLPRGWLRDWDLGVSFDVGGGFSDRLGVYGEFGASFPVLPSLRLSPSVAYFGKRGTLLSPDFSWGRVSDSGFYYTRGSVLAGWISDRGGADLRGIDRFGDPVGTSRGYVLARGLGNRRKGWSFVNQFEARSDSEVLRDFRSELESRYFAPESFSELFVPFGPFHFTALGRFRTLDTTESITAVPSLRVGLSPSRLGATRWNQEGWAGFLRGERADSADRALASAHRWEFAYRLKRPVEAARWLRIEPVAGVRQRVYDDVEGGGSAGETTLFEAGFDLSAAFHRWWRTRSEVWDIDGLIHRLEPVAGYRWMPRRGLAADEVPRLHPDVYTSGVDPLGFPNLVYRSDPGARQTLRLGVRNRFLAGRFGNPARMRSLGALDLYQEFNEGRPGAASRPANTMVSLRTAPAPWISLELFSRVETGSMTLTELVPGLRLRDGDRWESRWYFQSLQRRVNQLLWDAEIGITRRDRFLFEMRYDGQDQKVTRQAYGWSRRIGNAWIVKAQVVFRRDNERESDFQVNFSATSLLF